MNTLIDAPPETTARPMRSFTSLSLQAIPLSAGTEYPMGRSRLALCLKRGAAHGLRIVILAPREIRDPNAGPSRFPQRRVKPDAQVFWETGRRVLLGRGSLPHDRVGWHVLVADGDGCVVGTISARFTSGAFSPDHLQVLKLAAASGPILHEQCELAIRETHASISTTGRAFGEISDWMTSLGPHQRLISAMLIRGMAALAAAFENPVCVVAANQFRREVERLMRRGAAPLGRIGKFCLPPLIDQETSAWVRMLLLETSAFHARSSSDAEFEADLLRRRIAMVSVT